MSVKDITDKEVCAAYREYRDNIDESFEHKDWPYEILMRITGQPFKVCYRAMERAERHGLIEYGVSLRTGWLTEKGKELLRAKT